jgi:hypothetical protein
VDDTAFAVVPRGRVYHSLRARSAAKFGAIFLSPMTVATAANMAAKYLILLVGGPGKRESQCNGIEGLAVGPSPTVADRSGRGSPGR